MVILKQFKRCLAKKTTSYKNKKELLATKSSFFGAGDGSRTHLRSLGSFYSTDELRLLIEFTYPFYTIFPQKASPKSKYFKKCVLDNIR